jgi:predicted Zn-dependent protease with MMP-like domain
MKLEDEEFDSIVDRALGRIPPEIRDRMENIVISVQKRPSPELLESMEIPPDETLFGIFEGVPLSERSVTDPPLYPDTIFLFQESLEEACRSKAELEQEIEVTVVHEVAHYLGMDEEELETLGYA